MILCINNEGQVIATKDESYQCHISSINTFSSLTTGFERCRSNGEEKMTSNEKSRIMRNAQV
eukprot:scaffold7938_cov18-Prasinocladus_malaysianus.AAC.1